MLTSHQQSPLHRGLALAIVLSFAAVVVGELNNVGAAIGSLIIGILRAIAVHELPQVELFVVFAVGGGGSGVSSRSAVCSSQTKENSRCLTIKPRNLYCWRGWPRVGGAFAPIGL